MLRGPRLTRISRIFTVTVSGCASGVISEEIFDASMHGCAGAVSHSNRSAQCAAGWHACTAAEWNAHRGATVPGHIYWTGDNPLNFVSGVTNSCTVSATQGTNICGANSSMLVYANEKIPVAKGAAGRPTSLWIKQAMTCGQLLQ